MKSAKTIVIVASVVFLTLSLAGHSAERDSTTPARIVRTPTRPAPVRAAPIPVRIKPVEDPHKDSVIMLEAFMVEVRLSALHSLGVPQISRGPDSISADHIIKLIEDTDAAVITAGAKLALGQACKAKTDSTARKAIYTGPPDKRKTEYVNVGTSFVAIAEVRRDEKIFVELEFEHSGIEEGDVDADLGPPLVKRNWSVSLFLEPGKPTLVGAMQDKETAAFLLITANIKK